MFRLYTRKSLSFAVQHRLGRNLSFTRLLNFPRSASQSSTNAPLSTEEEKFAKTVRPGIRNQILFLVFGSSAALLYSAWATNIETSVILEKLKAQSGSWTTQNVTNLDLRRFQQTELVKQLRSAFKYLNSMLAKASEIPQLIRPYIGLTYVAVFQPYADASEPRRVCWKIVLLNTGIWLVWQLQRLQPMMSRSFVHQPLSGLSYTLLTSAFSHKSFLHLIFNCLALEGFGTTAGSYLRQAQDKNSPQQLESTSSYHFLAFYASAGVFASLVSHIASAKIRYPKLIAQLSSPASKPPVTETWASAVTSAASSSTRTAVAATTAATAVNIPGSLGASGAVYSCLTMTALAYPTSEISLIFPPTGSFNIQTGVMGLVALDVLGIVRGWRRFDHWAHLGGATFGALYYYYGPFIWSRTRAALMTQDT